MCRFRDDRIGDVAGERGGGGPKTEWKFSQAGTRGLENALILGARLFSFFYIGQVLRSILREEGIWCFLGISLYMYTIFFS